jgi:hypothetical protein
VQVIDIEQSALQGHKKSGLQHVKTGFSGCPDRDARLM